MKIKNLPRVEFQKNPIIEVIAQVRFPTDLAIQEGLPVILQKKLSKDFPLLEIQQGNTFEVTLEPQAIGEVKRSFAPAVYNMTSVDKTKRISLSSDFFAITFSKYSSWEEFIKTWEDAFNLFMEQYKPNILTRFGLRYRNLVNKKSLGLASEPWSELIHNTSIGHLYGDLLEQPIEEDILSSCFSVSQFNFEKYKLTLQTAFVDNMGAKCFLIDSDFFHENPLRAEELNLKKQFEVLHADTGSVFQAFIKKKLFTALDPKS